MSALEASGSADSGPAAGIFPHEPDTLDARLDRANPSGEIYGLGEILGRSRVMQDLFDALRREAPTDTTVLVTGETGTGKELIARSLDDGTRREIPRRSLQSRTLQP